MTCQPCQNRRRNFGMRKLFSQRSLFSLPQTVEITLRKDTEGTKAGFVIASIQGGPTIPQKAVRLVGITPATVSISLPSAGIWNVYYFTNERGGFPYNVRATIGASTIPIRVIQQYSRYRIGGVIVREPEPEPEPAPAPSVPAETMKPAEAANTNTPSTVNKAAKPRYRVISPPNRGGTKTESVRELTPNQLSSFKNRGYIVQQVDNSIPLQSAIVINHTPRPPTVPVFRRERSSRPRGRPKKPNWVPIGGRRERSHNRLVSQPVNHCWGFTRLMPNGGMAVFSGQPDHAYQGFLRQGFQLYNVQMEACSTPRLAYQSGRTAANWKKGKVVYASQSNEPTLPPAPAPAPNQGGGGGSGGGSSGGGGSGGGNYNNGGTTSGDIGRLIAELQGLKSQVNEINTRASQQLVDLGQSTVDRDNQIQQLDRWTQDQFSRIDQTLLALGQAQKDASAGLTAVQESILANIKQQIDGIKASVENADKGGFLGGLGDIFGGGNLPIILIMIVVLIVMIRK